MKTKILLLFLSLAAIDFCCGQAIITDSVYIYDIDGVQHWYKIQKDVYCFKLNNGNEYNGNYPAFVENHSYWNNVSEKFNEINFAPTCSFSERITCVQSIMSMNDFKISSISITEDDEDNTHQTYYRTDDIIIILFKIRYWIIRP